MANTSRILAELLWMDAEFILVSSETKNSMKQQEVVEKSQFFSKEYSKWTILAKMQKGEPSAKFSKLASFLAELC